jgi:hypothetical protein
MHSRRHKVVLDRRDEQKGRFKGHALAVREFDAHSEGAWGAEASAPRRNPAPDPTPIPRLHRGNDTLRITG